MPPYSPGAAFVDLLAGRPTEDAARRLRRHIDACDECCALLDALTT
jgi:hypothetical protein